MKGGSAGTSASAAIPVAGRSASGPASTRAGCRISCRRAPDDRARGPALGVGAALLAAQLYAESNFNPNAVSSAGAQGIAQFMPGTARTYGLTDPFDPGAAIDAQAHLMHDLLAQLGSGSTG